VTTGRVISASISLLSRTPFLANLRFADYPVIGSVNATAFIVTYFFPLDLPACTIAG